MTGIIGAMKIEIEALNAQMENRQTKTVSGIEFTSGTLCGREVMLPRAKAEKGIKKILEREETHE